MNALRRFLNGAGRFRFREFGVCGIFRLRHNSSSQSLVQRIHLSAFARLW
jgi:hypothetical protein